jgi:hypothetical protein
MGVEVWICETPSGLHPRFDQYGYGKTPHAAYLKWREKVDRA